MCPLNSLRFRVLGRMGRGSYNSKEREYAFANFDLQAGP